MVRPEEKTVKISGLEFCGGTYGVSVSSVESSEKSSISSVKKQNSLFTGFNGLMFYKEKPEFSISIISSILAEKIFKNRAFHCVCDMLMNNYTF